MTTNIGYARVSSADQNIEPQVAALKVAGCGVIRHEKASGRSRDGRSELANIMDFIHSGDSLVVTKLDRLGRSTRDVLNLVYDLEQKGAHLRVLEPDIDTSGPMGRMILTVLGMVAEMEVGFIRERQRVGIEAAKSRGVYRGRPIKLDHGRIREMEAAGVGATEIARQVGCSRGMVYKALGMLSKGHPEPVKASGNMITTAKGYPGATKTKGKRSGKLIAPVYKQNRSKVVTAVLRKTMKGPSFDASGSKAKTRTDQLTTARGKASAA